MSHIHTISIFLIILTTSCKQDRIPSINIRKEGAIGWGGKEPCKIIYSDHKREVESVASIKYRGGMSRKYHKHSFSLELDDKLSIGNLPRDDDWILNANYIDKTFMRHKISYDIFRQMSQKNIASKSSYINVSINEHEQGLYVLTEEINASMILLHKKDSLAMLFKDPPIFYSERLSYVQDSLNYYQQKYPKIQKNDKTYYIEKFKDFLFNSTDSLFVRDISKWVDIQNVIDWHIILLFSNNEDGIMKNFYLYKLDSQTPFRFAIWDYDHSFGRDGDNALNMAEKKLDWNRAILLKRLSQIAETGYLPKLKKRWHELRNLNIITLQNFKEHIDQNDKIINKVVDDNFAIWPCDSKWYFDNNNYQQEIDLMLQFVERRANELDEYITSL
jgi:hypothetical protein